MSVSTLCKRKLLPKISLRHLFGNGGSMFELWPLMNLKVSNKLLVVLQKIEQTRRARCCFQRWPARTSPFKECSLGSKKNCSFRVLTHMQAGTCGSKGCRQPWSVNVTVPLALHLSSSPRIPPDASFISTDRFLFPAKNCMQRDQKASREQQQLI